MTQPHPLVILRHLSHSNYNDVATRAAFTLAFATFPRLEQFTHKQPDLRLGNAFPMWFLTKSSVRVRGRGEYMELTLQSSKTDPFRKGMKVTIAGTVDNACPLRAIEQYLTHDTDRPYQAPRFRIGSIEQVAFSRESLVHKVQELASTGGLDQHMCNGHNRRGRAMTATVQVALPDKGIQPLGRWKSYAYKAYIQYSDTERILLTKPFQTSQATTLPP